MLTKKERFEKMNSAGIDTSKYFNISLPEGLAPGSIISVIIDETGKPIITSQHNEDEIYNNIIESGYVRNTRLHRRFVMAQMFYALNYVSYDGKHEGYNDYVKTMYGYDYTLTMMLDEIKVLSKLEERDEESFNERVHFFDNVVVATVLRDYLVKLRAYIDSLPNKKCKGVPYKVIKGKNIFNDDLEKKIYAPIHVIINRIMYAKNYTEVYKALNEFMKNRIKLPYSTPKSKVWFDTYKGEGAFYTCKNLIMFHDCKVYDREVERSRDGSMEVLNRKLDKYRGEGWRMFAFMKKLIADNEFDFNKKMNEIYSK